MAKESGKVGRCRIAAHVAGEDTKDLRGERGTVLGVQGGQYQKNGEQRVSVRLDDGRIVGVPAKALERD